jgi:hypothetical protein
LVNDAPSEYESLRRKAAVRTDLRIIASGLIIGSCFVSSVELDVLLCGVAIALFALAGIGK